MFVGDLLVVTLECVWLFCFVERICLICCLLCCGLLNVSVSRLLGVTLQVWVILLGLLVCFGVVLLAIWWFYVGY